MIKINLIVETFVESNRTRLRALPGQGVDVSVRFSFSLYFRERYPVGTLFEVWARWVVPTHIKPYLRVERNEIIPITPARARELATSASGRGHRSLSAALLSRT